MDKDRLDAHLKKISSTLGGKDDPAKGDKLDWYLNNISGLLQEGGGLKTINGESLAGEGDIVITTFKAFPAAWNKTTSSYTTKAFCDQIDADETAVIGMGYFGGAKWKDKPEGLANFDIVVEILAGPNNTKAIHLIGTSSSVYPYRWEYTYWSHGSVSGWRGVQPELTTTSVTDGTPTTVIGFDSQGSIVKVNTPATKMYNHKVILDSTHRINIILPFADSINNHTSSLTQGVVGTLLHPDNSAPTLGLGWIFWNVDEWSLWDATGTEIAYASSCNDIITELE